MSRWYGIVHIEKFSQVSITLPEKWEHNRIIAINGVDWVFDYANNIPRVQSEMTEDDRKASLKAEFELIEMERKL